MFASRKFSITKLVGALAMSLGLASATPAAAHDNGGFHHGGGFHQGGGFHGPWGHDHWRRGYGGPAFAIGFMAAGYDACVTYRPVYDPDGNVIGRRLVNVCE